MRTLFCVVACAAALAMPAEAKIASQPWGAMANGEKVDLYTLTDAKGAEARIATYGGVLVGLTMPDKNGHYGDVVEGYDTLAEYLGPEKGGSYGALLGRYANRIKGAHFPLEGKTVELTPSGGGNSIHGGPVGFGKRVWSATPHDGSNPSLTLELTSADADQGFPGTMHVTVTYTLTGNTLRIDYRATTDKPTVANLSNHSFFNLRNGGDISDYVVPVFADAYTPAAKDMVPTGEIKKVTGTPFDLTQPTVIGPRLSDSDPQIALANGYDHNMVIRGRPGTLRRAARVHDPVSGRTVEAWTTQPGMQLYTSNTAKPVTGKGGVAYGKHTAICLETQHFPNSPNQPEFPSTEVTPDKPLHEVTEFRFSAQ